MPCSAMQKLSVRNGCMLRCACEPPVLPIDPASIATRFDAPPYDDWGADLPSTVVLAGVLTEALDVPLSTCVCVGISAIDRVCACSPPRSPSVCPLPT